MKAASVLQSLRVFEKRSKSNIENFRILYIENVKAFKTSSLYKNAKASNVP